MTDTMTAAQAAEDLRAKVTAGAAVPAAELAAAEAAERLECLAAEGEARRAEEAAEKAQAERRAEALADVQERWQAAHDPAVVAELDAAMDAAVEAAVSWLRMFRDRQIAWDDLIDDARTVGFRVDDTRPAHLRSPLAQLGRAVMAEASGLLHSDDVNRGLDSRSNVWEAL